MKSCFAFVAASMLAGRVFFSGSPDACWGARTTINSGVAQTRQTCVWSEVTPYGLVTYTTPVTTTATTPVLPEYVDSYHYEYALTVSPKGRNHHRQSDPGCPTILRHGKRVCQ